jgi:Serine dehydratase beta chain
MVIQELTPQSAFDKTAASEPGLGSLAFAPEAIAPAHLFASAFTGSPAGFAPSSILIELFGALAHPAAASQITSGVLLGLAGFGPGLPLQAEAAALLKSIDTHKSLFLNKSIEVPYIASEHLMLHSASLTPTHPEGIRLTAYHCVHPFVTRQFYASTSPNPSSHTSGNTLTFTEC